MSTRTILVVFLALLSGAGVAAGVLHSNRPKNEELTNIETEPVLVAVANLERGRAVTEADIVVREWPKGLAPADTLRSVEAAKGRAALGRILVGEVVREVKLASEGMGLGLEPVIPVGMRAVSVTAARITTNVAGFVLPGSKVDVLLNLRASGRDDNTGGGSTTTLLQAVEVLAVDQKQDAPESHQFDPKALASVTLLVTPEQANVLDLAQNMGTLSFALRNATDVADAEVEAATLTKIRRLAMPPQSQDSSETQILDPDAPLTDEARARLDKLVGRERAEPRNHTWIETFRGTQRGRLVLTEVDQRR
jgi:pilus assembly protein CpaB